MNASSGNNNMNNTNNQSRKSSNQNIQVYVRVRPLNVRERGIRSNEVVDVVSAREIVARHSIDSKLTKKFTFDRAFGPDSRQVEVYNAVVAPLIEEVLAGYNCTVFAYGQTGTGKTHTMVGNDSANLGSSWDDNSDIGIIPRALSHLFDELRMLEMEFSMRVSYLELYNEELCDLLSSDDATKIRIFDDSNKKGSVIVQGLEEIPVNSKDDVYKLLEKGMERRKTAKTLMNAQSSRSHTVFSILVHIRETGIDNEVMLKLGKLNLVDLAGSENVSKAGNEKAIRVRETVNINQSLLTLGRVITALVERTPHIPYRESKLTRLLQESLGGRTKTSIIATISPGHKDIEETLSTLEYAHRAKNIQNKPEVNQKLTQRIILKEYTEEIDKLKRDLMAARDKNGIYLADETYNEMTLKMDAQSRELNEKVLLLKALKDELLNKEQIFNEVSMKLIEKTENLQQSEQVLTRTKTDLLATKKTLNNTKRRYMEKKELLQHHMHTEEVLITQAKQILQVADVATKDTEKLHCTLERRRDVDRRIETASERLVSFMSDNFNKMYEQLDELCKESDSYVGMILEELNESTSQQNRLVQETNQKIADISASCQQVLHNMVNIQNNSSDILHKLNNNNLQQVSEECEKTNQQQKTFLQQLRAQLQDLMKNGELQQISMKQLPEKTQKLLQCQALAAKQHMQVMQQRLHATQNQFEEISNEIMHIEQSAHSEIKAEEQAQSMVQNFVQDVGKLQMALLKNMQNLGAQRQKNFVDLRESTGRIGVNAQQCKEQVQEMTAATTLFCEKQQQCGLQQQSEVEKHVVSVDQNITRNCNTVEQMLLQTQVVGEQFQEGVNKLKLQAEQQEVEVQKVLHQQLTAFETNVAKCKQEQIISQQSAQVFLEAQSKFITDKHLLAGSLAKSVQQEVLLPYAEKYKNLHENCLDNVMGIKQSELKIYQPTGSTPNKREFSYPRILATTSPHEKIIEHFRQAHDYSDLEAMTEDSELETTELSIHDNVGADPVLNSTPFGNKTEKESIQCENGNYLTTNNILLENMLQPINSPCKRSQTTTPLKKMHRSFSPVSSNDKENNI